VRLRGRHLLDHEALSCLLVLLFIDEPKLNTTRLHRVLRNLCYHGPTRDWVVRSLLSILERSNEARSNTADQFPITSTPSTKGKRITAKAITAMPTPDSKVLLMFLVVFVQCRILSRFVLSSMPLVSHLGSTSALMLLLVAEPTYFILRSRLLLAE